MSHATSLAERLAKERLESEARIHELTAKLALEKDLRRLEHDALRKTAAQTGDPVPALTTDAAPAERVDREPPEETGSHAIHGTSAGAGDGRQRQGRAAGLTGSNLA